MRRLAKSKIFRVGENCQLTGNNLGDVRIFRLKTLQLVQRYSDLSLVGRTYAKNEKIDGFNKPLRTDFARALVSKLFASEFRRRGPRHIIGGFHFASS